MGHHPVSDLFIVVGERGLGQTNVRVQDPIRIREPSRVCDGLPPGRGRPIIGARFGEMLCNLPTDRRGRLIRPEALEARLPQNTFLRPFGKSYFRILREEFADCSDIVTVTSNGKAVASVLNFYFRDQVLPYYGGGTAAARALAANDFMYWEVMRRACERGYRVFDFGRSKLGTGSYAFKRNWGFAAVPMHYQYQLTSGHGIPDLNPLNPKLKLFVSTWKHMPLPLARLFGPAIVRGIG